MDADAQKGLEKKLKKWKKEIPTGNQNIRLITNAPSHWPAVEVPRLKLEDPVPGDKEGYLFITLTGSLLEKAESQGIPLEVGGIFQTRLFDDGILKIPLIISERNKKRSIFFYPLPTRQASSHFAGVRALLEAAGEDSLIYYSTGALSNEQPSSPLVPFEVNFLTRFDGELPKGEYAMWWGTKEEPKFSSSKTNHYLGRTYAALDHIESYALGCLLQSFKMVDEKSMRVVLPNDLSLAVRGPEDMIMMLTATKEKGIRFHFNTSLTSIQYRERFLKHFAIFVEKLRSIIDEKRLPTDSESDYRPSGWFSATQRVMCQQEKEGMEMEKIGLLIFHEVPNSLTAQKKP